MNKVFNKILVICGLFSLCNVSFAREVKANENTYITWNPEITYRIEKELDALPVTFECNLQLPKTNTSDAGVLIGNRGNNNEDCLNFAVNSAGNPFLFFRYNNTRYNINFTDVDVRTESEFVHLVVTRDVANEKAHCYLNGELKQSVDFTIQEYTLNSKLMLGGDNWTSNSRYFRGKIESIALYKDLRTETEIQSGTNMSASDENLMLGYSLVNLEDDNYIQDISKNDRDVKKIVTWVDVSESNRPEEFDYSFAVVGDTQYVNKRFYDNFPKIYDYILDNQEEFNIQHVFGLGDITDTSAKDEWQRADEQFARLDEAGLPYSLVRGNHDNDRWFEYVFGPETKYTNQYTNQYFDFYNVCANSAHEINTDILDYIVITLDFGATDDVLDWAAGIIEDHPNHNIIISTHGYLAADGTTLDATDPGRPSEYGSVYNDGDEMWDKLIKKYENIVMVLSGHIGSDDIVMTQTEGDHGNIVSQFLINPQYVDDRLGGVGLVSMFYFQDEGRKVTVDYYSTIEERYFKRENQFTFDIHTVERKLNNDDNNNNNNDNNNQNSSGVTSSVITDSNDNTSSGGTINFPKINLDKNTLMIAGGVVVGIIVLFLIFRKRD